MDLYTVCLGRTHRNSTSIDISSHLPRQLVLQANRNQPVEKLDAYEERPAMR
jgi:hypothetical protein